MSTDQRRHFSKETPMTVRCSGRINSSASLMNVSRCDWHSLFENEMIFFSYRQQFWIIKWQTFLTCGLCDLHHDDYFLSSGRLSRAPETNTNPVVHLYIWVNAPFGSLLILHFEFWIALIQSPFRRWRLCFIWLFIFCRHLFSLVRRS